MLAEFVIKKVEHEKENSNSKPLPGKNLFQRICEKVQCQADNYGDLIRTIKSSERKIKSLDP